MARFARQREINRINVKHVEDDRSDARKGTEVTVKLIYKFTLLSCRDR